MSLDSFRFRFWKCVCLFAAAFACARAGAQTYTVTQSSGNAFGSLADAITQANAGNYSTIVLQSGLGNITVPQTLFVYANVTIVGNNNLIDMQENDRAFFIAGGQVVMQNLTIANGMARGGNGGVGGGGAGAGLGGGVFVANGPSISSYFTMTSNVTFTNVTFQNNFAIGGNGSQGSEDHGGAGGGGMGGNGGALYNTFPGSNGGGGGGGFGPGANGGNSDPDHPGNGTAGTFLPGNTSISMGGGIGGHDDSGDPGGIGGLNGGGGGGANSSGAISVNSPGGGGGVGGLNALTGNFQFDGLAGNGGFGGGGGGGDDTAPSGTGGFGGGGGASGGLGAQGGFGGSSGATSIGDIIGGFGAGGSGNSSLFGDFFSGGGLGAGGALFVQLGANVTIEDPTFVLNGVNGGNPGGSPAMTGSAIGRDVFLGANTTFSVSTGNTLTLTDLSNSGNLADPNVAAQAGDPNAQGGLIKTGGGTLVLTGNNYYSGPTNVANGTLLIQGYTTTNQYISSGGNLQITNNSTTLASLDVQGGCVTVSGGNLTNTNPSTVQSGCLTITGSYNVFHSLTITGGVVEIAATAQNTSANVYVEGGELVLNGNISNPGPNILTMNGGVISGNGSFVFLTMNGGALSPGVGGAGQLTGNTLTWVTGNIEITQLNSLGTPLEVDNFLEGGTGPYFFQFADVAGAQPGDFYSLAHFLSTSFSASDFSYTAPNPGFSGNFSISGGSLFFEVLTVPEPAAYAAVAGGSALLFAWRRRRAGRRSRP